MEVQSSVGDPAESTVEEDPGEGGPAEGEGDADEDAASQLPEGFFDNPDLDAQVRGLEAPSVRQQRELEEGLKTFEREIAKETERAEETRHELDEQKYEEVAAEEEDF